MNRSQLRLNDLFEECFIDKLYNPKSIIESIKFSFKDIQLCKYRYYDVETKKTFCRFYIQTQPFFSKEYLKEGLEQKFEQLKLFEVDNGIYTV